MRMFNGYLGAAGLLALVGALTTGVVAQRTAKPVLHGRHWMAVTGKPLAATAGAAIFQKKGNAVDAACAMIAATSTMWDTLGWGGETQALIYNPKTKKVIGINALGVAPTGATPEFFKAKKLEYPPAYGPLAAVTPGTPGGILVMLAEFGTLSLKDVLEPAIQMADGYPMEASLAGQIERQKGQLKQWPYSKAVFLPHRVKRARRRRPARCSRSPTWRPRSASWSTPSSRRSRPASRGRTPSWRPTTASTGRHRAGDRPQHAGAGRAHHHGRPGQLEGLPRRAGDDDLQGYRGLQAHHLGAGPRDAAGAEHPREHRREGDGYNSPRYMHAVYQAMSMAFATATFYYGDPYVPPVEPIKGLLSKEYAKARFQAIDWEKNDPNVKPGDPYPFQGEKNPYAGLLAKWTSKKGLTSVTPAHDIRTAGRPQP